MQSARSSRSGEQRIEAATGSSSSTPVSYNVQPTMPSPASAEVREAARSSQSQTNGPAGGPPLALLDIKGSKAQIGLQIQMPTPVELQTPYGVPSPIELGANVLLSPKFPTPPTASESEPNAFTPYFMHIAEPRAPELQRQPSVRGGAPQQKSKSVKSGGASTRHSSASASIPASASAASSALTSPVLSPCTAADGAGYAELAGRAEEAGGTAGSMLKRSLSSLLRRSTSIVRRTDSNNRRKVDGGGLQQAARSRSSLQSPTDSASSSAATSPRLAAAAVQPAGGGGDFGEALTASTFSVGLVNASASPLIGNSMVHVKVVMDADTIAIVPMVRTIVFARARERILTKLFQGGVPFVESKRRKLALRRPDGSLVVVADNPAWRGVMEAAAAAKAQQPQPIAAAATAAAPGFKTVVKLTLHLIDPADITGRLDSTGCRAAEPAALTPPVAARPAVAL
ncbi:hypothetical protein GGI04_001874 [Coemansia thaxteri]|nr:hypothetical protein GGI04_001874 [Coemansia thaxteri]KAJ2473225.1 hypothetical protein GGI02_001022 [Coemansia sp. RSA 2322]KAJ2488032.1 hypothetical protein EV174_000138 [Coemansia sp. RSA 2320]